MLRWAWWNLIIISNESMDFNHHLSVRITKHINFFRSLGVPVWDSTVFLKLVTYRPTPKKSTLYNWISIQASLCESYTVALIETQPHQHISSEESGTSVISNPWRRASPWGRKNTSVKTTRALKGMEEDNNTEEVTESNDSNWVSKELGKEEDDEEGEY